jgi:4,5-DOPA dioxygenase extradiol
MQTSKNRIERPGFPVAFIGHGTPLNALDDNAFTRGWAALAAKLARPRAILSISAHWYTRGTAVTAMERPRTIHDFGYNNLQHLSYPAPGDPILAEEVANLLAPIEVVRDHSWGLDHGTWTVLLKAYPEADIPVVQLSIDGTKPPQFHRELGRRLAPLRDKDILILATGNIVHNLEHFIRSPGGAPPFAWAERFDRLVRDKLTEREWDAVVDYESLGADATKAVPTPDHYLPLVYALGAANPEEPISFPIEGIAGGSMSMRSIFFGLL